MGQRSSNLKKFSTRLSVKKETLRQLQARVLDDAALREVVGGRSGTCTMDHCAPSCNGC